MSKSSNVIYIEESIEYMKTLLDNAAYHDDRCNLSDAMQCLDTLIYTCDDIKDRCLKWRDDLEFIVYK